MKINTCEKLQYKYVYFLAILYMTLMTCTDVLGNKLIDTPMGVLSAASIISPFWFVLGDVITEVYGFKINMRMFWSVIICQFIFSIICSSLIDLDSPAFWADQNAYDLVLGHSFKYAIFQFIGLTVGWNLNARILVKWKVLMHGKYFWLRSIGSSGIGLIIFSFVSVFPSVFGSFPTQTVVSIVIWSCVLKILFTALLAFPNTLIVVLLQHAEGIDNESKEFKFNPFESVQRV